MPRWISTYPDVEKLESILAEYGPVRIVDRAAAMYTSTFLSEVLTCRFPDGTERKLLGKYGDTNEDCVFGHKGGLPYEAGVYRNVLGPLRLSTPQFYASGNDPESQDTWLFIEYMDDAMRLNLTKEVPIEDVCRWIGLFHRSSEHFNHPAGSLNRYTNDYYAGWARRSMEYSAPAIADFPWLPDICKQFEDMVELLNTWRVLSRERFGAQRNH
jgi:hypothetical protein